MHVSVEPASRSEVGAFSQLMQLYAYDFSEILPLDVDDGGLFPDVAPERWWAQAWRQPFLLRADGRLAGFAIVDARSRLSGASGVSDMAEFFVLRRYRRAGAGRVAAFELFDRFAGPWEIRQRKENADATVFWRRVVDQYSGGAYEDLSWDDSTWSGPVQRFESRRAPAR